jgi:hypothetical protein
MSAETTKLEIKIVDALPMSIPKQAAILGHLLTDRQFFLTAFHRIRPDWFREVYHQKLYKIVASEFMVSGNIPTIEEVTNSKTFYREDLNVRERLSSTLKECLGTASLIRLESIKPELTEWLQAKIWQSAMVVGAKSWNLGKYPEVALLMEDASRMHFEAKFEEGAAIDFLDFPKYLAETELEKSLALTTGLSLLDKAMLTNATSGGMRLRDTTVVLAPSNIGKTNFLITVIGHNIRLGKDVLFMTHEGAPSDLRMMIIKSVGGWTEKQLLDLYKTPEGFKEVQMVTALIHKHLRYIPYNKAGMAVEDCLPIIRREQECRRLETGKGFDLFVCDYPAKLTTHQAAKGNFSPRHIWDYVYGCYVQLALEYGWHSLVVIQSNREGSKENNGFGKGDEYDSHRILMMEDVFEAWGVMTSASNVLTLNRGPLAKRKGLLSIYVAKSRSSQTGIVVVAKTAFERTSTHSDLQGSVSYEGVRTRDSHIELFIKSHPNQHLDISAFDGFSEAA